MVDIRGVWVWLSSINPALRISGFRAKGLRDARVTYFSAFELRYPYGRKIMTFLRMAITVRIRSKSTRIHIPRQPLTRSIH